jgi:hypothetical protein
MANKPSLFDAEDDEDEILALKAKRAAAGRAKPEDNPLSFFSFGSPATPAATAASKPAPKPTLDHGDDDDDDDDFFTSPPGSLKTKKTPTTTAFDLDEEDAIELPKPHKGASTDHGISFKDALHPGGLRPSLAAPAQTSTTDKQKIASLEEQLAKATQTIKKLKEKEKAVRFLAE